MTTTYAKHFNTRETPQSQPIPGSNQVQNNAGGFVFEVNDWTRLDRFLILGSEGNTYYCTEKKMTIDNAQCVLRCLAEDGIKTVNRIAYISQSGRAPKNDPAIFALAIAAGYKHDDPNDTVGIAVRQEALKALDQVCRIPTHLFTFVETVKAFRGRGRALQNALGRWYLEKDLKELVYHVIKYQSRNGWSNKDVLRLARPSGVTGIRNDVFHWITKGWDSIGPNPHPDENLRLIWAFERAKRATNVKEIVCLIDEFNLPRECIPTHYLGHKEVWEVLLENMPMTAMIRNLATMTRVGLLAPLSAGVNKVVSELANQEKLQRARIHPIAVLAALKTYAQGHGERGSNTWTPVQQIVDALDSAFYLAFKNVEPTNKRWLLGVDVSGSMGWGNIAGIPGLTPNIAAAAMSLVTANTEPNYYLFGFSTQFTELKISPRQRLDDVVRYMGTVQMGGTDCSVPIQHALTNKIPVDVFVTYTDNETWAGNKHPCQVLKEYRQRMGIPAKLITVGFTSTGFSIADPNDSGSLDVVGFDAGAPEFMNDFVRN